MKRLIRVKVVAGARKEKVVENADGSYVVSVREEAKAGQANRRVKEIMVSLFGTVSGVRVIMVKGSRSRSKIFEIIQ